MPAKNYTRSSSELLALFSSGSLFSRMLNPRQSAISTCRWSERLKKLAVLIIAVSILQGCAAQKEDAAAPESRIDAKTDAKKQVDSQPTSPKMVDPEQAPPESAAMEAAPPEAAMEMAPPPEAAEMAAPKTGPPVKTPKRTSSSSAKPRRFMFAPKPTPATMPKPVPPAQPSAEPQPRMASMPKPDPGDGSANPLRTYPLDDPAESMPKAAAASVDPALKHDKPGYTTVKIFYGTDRAAEFAGPWTQLGTVPWGYLTAAAGAFCFLVLIVLAVKRNRYVASLFVLSIVAAAALFICASLISRNTKPQETHLAKTYGNDRGTLEVGTCEVSIPEKHEVGELERPSILRFEFNEDPKKHVVLLAVKPEATDKYFAELKSDISKSAGRQAFVFVHGFNVTFEGAALRTAQLKYDLAFDGPAIFYSWPSQGGLLQYAVDENNVVWTVAHLEEFITDIARKTGVKQLHLIAHSMGNRALTAALERLSRNLKPDELPMFNEVVLTAPDIDAEVFCRDIAPAIVKTANRVTLYASSNDGALAASKKIHGYPRAGESGENIVVVPGIDTIDVSKIDTSLLGHTYYGDNDTVITDIVQLLRESKPPGLRDRLRAAMSKGRKYWVFRANGNGEL